MIKASIIDADSDAGGELLRLLVHHPDVELVSAVSPGRDGQLVSEYHHGLVGDTDLRFTDNPDFSHTDVVFITRPGTALPASLKDDARVIDLTGQFIGHEGFVTGIGELNRKDMVRGAMRAAIPGAATQAAVIALLPLAKRGELHGEIVVEVAGVADTDVVKAAVLQLQPDFDGRISIVAAPDGFPFTARVTFPTNCTGSDVRAIYREEFADHNFVFVIPRRPVPADVTNTNKCLLHLHVQDSALTIEALMDASVKGAAGTAVHCMNLLFGLHEVIGLQLKALGR